MRLLHRLAILVLLLTAAASLGAGLLSRHGYAEQYRDHSNEAPSREFPLGTDDLGRDRWSRLLYGCRVSLICAPAAAAMATAIAACLGLLAGYFGGWIDEGVGITADLFLSLPWLFALLTLRALLPLNASPLTSVAALFLLLAGVGWASSARVVRASVTSWRNSAPILHALAAGCSRRRVLLIHLLPNVRPVLAAQFWILVPVFLIAEANLGMLGLGISEPMPSLGNILSELQDYHRIPEAPWMLAPAALLVLVIASLHFVVSGSDTWE